MLYLGIDLHGKQMTVCVRNQQGDVTVRRQVSTRPAKVEQFLEQLAQEAGEAGYVALVEVCGFHDWLVKRLMREPACHDVVLIQPEKRSKQKTDRRDTNRLSELLWVNRERRLAGEKVQGVRRVYFPSDQKRQDRQVTSLRQRLGRRRTQTMNQIHYLLRRNNLEWQRPTKGFQTKRVKSWLTTLKLDETDQLEMDQLLEQWAMWDRQIDALQEKIVERFQNNDAARLLATIIGVQCYTALAITSRIGDISRFPSARSLANFFGLTPGSRSSGEKQQLGAITKEGSRIVRFLLGQLVLHVLRRDAKMRAWYQRIKHRRGAKIARVAVMRRLTVIMWHMLSKQQKYQFGGVPKRSRPAADDPTTACLPIDRRALLAQFGVELPPDAASGVSTGSPSPVVVVETSSGAVKGAP